MLAVHVLLIRKCPHVLCGQRQGNRKSVLRLIFRPLFLVPFFLRNSSAKGKSQAASVFGGRFDQRTRAAASTKTKTIPARYRAITTAARMPTNFQNDFWASKASSNWRTLRVVHSALIRLA